MATTTLPSCHTRTDSKDSHRPLSPARSRPKDTRLIPLPCPHTVQTHLILAGSMKRSLLATRGGGGDDCIAERELLPVCIRAPSRASRSSLENDLFLGRRSWAPRAVIFTRLPSFVRPAPLTMPFGDDGMASMMVVSKRRLALAVVSPESGAEGGGWSKGS